MKKPFFKACIQALFFLLFTFQAFSQVETLSTGSFIINMGATNPNTVGNGLKPYGLVYDLIKNNKVPVKWVISQTKLKDGADFSYNGTDYKGGTFIIPAEFRTAAVNSRITFWQGQGVVGTTTISALTVDVTRTLIAVPRWTLDAANGSIAQGYLTNAGITLTAFPGAYNFKAVAALDCCDDFFVMPHADPTWATHGRLFTWNRDCLGSIWAACHAVSALENSINPSNSAEQMNFLSTRNILTTPTPWPNNSLKLWGTHGGGSVPYSYQYPSDQVAQFMGTTDLAQLNGSEQIYIPKQSTDPGGATRWRPGSKIIGYDPTQANVLTPDLANGNVAATIVYGRAFDDVNRGFVMYEAGHSHNKGTVADVAAQRAFLNFSFFQVQPKAPQLTFTGIGAGQSINGNSTITGLNVSASSPLSGITFTYQWSSSCGGTFSNQTGSTTNFTAPVVGSTTSCVISCVVSDNCGRTSFQSFPVTILGAAPPVANPDVQTVDPGCGAVSLTYNVLSNDTEPDGQPMTLTNVTGVANGSISFTATGNITYTSNAGFVGVETLTYTVCDNTSPVPLCSNGTYTINVGNPANLPNAVNDAFTIAEDNIGTFNVLANDLPVVSGPYVVSAITTGPSNGRVSINTDNTITYVPNADFAGTDNFTYRIVNSIGYSRTATVTVTVTNDACDGGTYQSAAGSSGTVTYNTSIADMAMYYQAPINLINNGIRTSLEVTGNTGELPRRALLHFDLSTLPGGITITNADLRMRRSGGNNTSQTIDIYRMTTDWNEGTLNNAANTLASNGATWYGPTFSTKWNTIGGDFTTTNGASLTGLTTNNTIYSWNVSTITQGWYNSTFPNYGFIIKDPTEANNNDKIFDSRENGTLANRPTLRITYNPGNVTVDIVADRDNWIYESTVQKIFEGNTTTFQVNADGPNSNEARLLLKFDVKPADIPTGSTVTSATMKLTRTGGDNLANNIGAYQATNSWNEGLGDNTNNTANLNGATWFNRNFTQLWNTNGGDFTLTGGAVTSVSTATGGTSATANYNWDVSSIVQNWVKTSPDPNHGFIIKSVAENVNDQKVFGTRENITAGNRPTLIVNYNTPGVCSAIPGRAPLAMPDTATTNSSTVITIPVATNDELFGQPITSITISTAPSSGSAVVVGNSIQYTPAAAGVATLQYTITTANGSDVVRVYINVTGTPVNAIDDTPAGALSGAVQTINVKANDIDPEGTAASTVTLATAPKNGTATVNGSGEIVYTPNVGFTGNDTLTYSICEPAPTCGMASCDTARVVIVVQNRVPVANNDSKTILPCFANSINLLGNDTDAENGALTVTNLSDVSPVGAGTLINNNDGTVTFTPTSGLAPLPQNITFTYTVTDNGVTPEVSAPATVTITVSNPVNTAPIAVNDVELTNMDQVLFASVRDNDSDPENQTLTIPSITVAPLHGTAIVNAVTGQIEYTPNPGFSGTDVLTYLIRDIPIIDPNTCTSAPDLSATATLTITVVSPNIVVGINDQNSTWINTAVSGSTLLNDFDPQMDLPLISGGFIIGGIPYTSGTRTVSGFDFSGTPLANAGTLTINAGGTYTYTPATDFIGVINVQYQVDDSNPNTATDFAYLRITVNPLVAIGNSVIANNDESVVLPNITINSTLFVNDADPQGNTFTVTSFIYDTNGDGTKDGTGTVNSSVTVGGVTTAGTLVANAGSLTINTNGTYSFVPASDFSGLAEIEYTITDALGAVSSALLKIDVMPDVNGVSNNEPFAGDDFKYTNVNTTATGSAITSSDGDPNGNTISVSQIGSTPVAGSTTVATPNGFITIQPDGSYSYTPNAGYVGPDQISYNVCDNGAPSLFSNSTLYFLVGVNNRTKALNDENSTWQDVNVSGVVLANDYDAENNTQTFGSFLLQNLAGNITTGATLSGVDKSGGTVLNAGTLSFDASGNYNFDPAATFTGSVLVPYRICDNGNLAACDTAYLLISVDPQPNTGINTVIANDDENISYGGAVSSTLFYNDKDPQNNTFAVTLFRYDSNGDGVPDVNTAPGTVTVAGVSYNGDPVANAGSLTINTNGTYTYTPAVGFVGKIDVPYIITDALGAATGALLHIDVLADANGPGNDAPFAADDFGYTTINLAVSGTVLSNDSDPNTNGLSVTAQTTTLPGVGTLVLASNGTYTFTPVTGYIGPATFTYQVCDVTAVAPQPLCADAVLHVLVGPGININGKVWDDANGNVIDAGAAEPETNAGGTLYVNLVNGAGNVVATSAVAADGSYSFADITPGISYSLVLSTTQGTIGSAAPAAALPAGWTGTGENRNGTIDLGTLNVIDNLTYGFTNTANFDFGIEQLPTAAAQSYTIPQPVLNSFLTLNGTGAANSPAQLSGTDPEDGAIGTGATMTITTVPTNAELYYDFGAGPVLLTSNTSISNYDPSKLQVKFTTLGSQIITFNYSITDAAGKADPTAAAYTINLLNGLPVEGLSLSAALSGTIVTLNWKTLNESNTSYFEIERSTDNRSFTKTGKQVNAAGSSVSEMHYKQTDDIKDLQTASIVYYRIKLTDVDGKISYSNVAAVRITKTIGIKAWPNPFVNSVQVQINSQVNTEVELRITDVEGRTILVQRNQVIRGNNQLGIEDLQRLPSGTYLLEVINKSDLSSTWFKLIRQ